MNENMILLVEQDEMILAFVGSVLNRHGYRVLQAHNGIEALRIAARLGPWQIDLLLTDVDTPTLGGVGLVRRWKHLRPDLKVLCMTGRPGRLTDELGDGCSAIEKPFSYTALLRSVEACLLEEKAMQAAG
jgi:two-component system, cell cycle sensor histidine kinase and response regulator CckA